MLEKRIFGQLDWFLIARAHVLAVRVIFFQLNLVILDKMLK